MSGNATVLIVDDNPAARETLEELLASENYRLAFAASGPEALQKAVELMPDVILLDVMMPGMDGFEVCTNIRSDPLLAEVPIVLVTALDDEAARVQGLMVGADEFISKPFERTELRTRVRSITRLNRYRLLLAERMKFDWLAQHASDGYLILSAPRGGDDRPATIIYANAQARLYLNLPQEGDIRVEFWEAIRNRYHCEPENAWSNWPNTDRSGPLYLVQPESLTAKAFWLQVDQIDLPSGPDQRLVRLHDITAQVHLQHEVWGFHSAISHKLRTPLFILLNSLELQARRMTQMSAEEIARTSEVALSSVNRLRQDVGDVLQYLNISLLAKPGEGFDVSRLEKMTGEIGEYLGLVPVTVSADDGLNDARLTLSERGFELVLWEILENAKKFHPAGDPNVDIVAFARDNPGRGGREAVIRIVDDGVTLSPEQLSQVWTPYYQGEKYHTGQMQGIGLGLSVVASLIWGAGGTYRMINREGMAGIVVELVVPLAQQGA